MSEIKVLEVQQGVWIDEHLLRTAGLGLQLRVTVQPGEIRILPAATQDRTPQPDVAPLKTLPAWEVFRSLGRDAQPGRLLKASEEHDRYLYGRRP